jgi:hypothetical protein
MWAALGLALSVFTAIFALQRAKRVRSNYYAAEVYGMTAAVHRRYAVISLIFGAAFVAAFFAPIIPTVPLLAVYALVAIFYFSSFARGFSDEP